MLLLIILFVCVESAIGGLRIAEVKLPQRITQMFHLPIYRIEPLLQCCSCSSKSMMNSISNRIHLSIYLHFNGHFPDEPGLAGIY